MSSTTTLEPNYTSPTYVLAPLPDPAIIEANYKVDLDNAMLGIPSSFSTPFVLGADGKYLTYKGKFFLNICVEFIHVLSKAVVFTPIQEFDYCILYFAFVVLK